MVLVGYSASPRSGPWSVGRWLARSTAIHAPLERPAGFALGFPHCVKKMTSVLFTLGRRGDGGDAANPRQSQRDAKAARRGKSRQGRLQVWHGPPRSLHGLASRTLPVSTRVLSD